MVFTVCDYQSLSWSGTKSSGSRLHSQTRAKLPTFQQVCLLCHNSVSNMMCLTNRVLSLILRGVCLMRPSEIAWMFGGGAAHLQPLVSFAAQTASCYVLPASRQCCFQHCCCLLVVLVRLSVYFLVFQSICLAAGRKPCKLLYFLLHAF